MRNGSSHHASGALPSGASATVRRSMTSLQTDVIVVGAGPTGLALANALRAYGTDVAVLERRQEPSVESRAVAVHARSLEVLETIGLAASLAGAGVVVPRAAVRDG